jgi:hypothetical protein
MTLVPLAEVHLQIDYSLHDLIRRSSLDAGVLVGSRVDSRDVTAGRNGLGAMFSNANPWVVQRAFVR